MKLSELRKRLAPGTIYRAEFIGRNRSRAKPEIVSALRRVKKNGIRRMISVIIEDGVEPGTEVETYLNWENVVAEERDGDVYLISDVNNTPEEFLKITFVGDAS